MAGVLGGKVAYYGFTGIIEPAGVTRLCAALNHAINNKCDEIYLCLSSPGGTVADGVFLYNHIRSLPITITVHNTGSVSSAAVTAFVAAERRFCSPHAMFMVHPTTLGPFQEAMAWERLQAALNAALADDQRTEDILRERTSITDDLLSAKRVKEVFFTPDLALKFGLVHGVQEFSLPKGNEILQI